MSPPTCCLAVLLLLPRPGLAQAYEPTNSTQRISYALGMDVVRALKVDDFDLNLPAVQAGVTDMLAGKPAMTPAEQKAALRELRESILAKAVAKKEAAGVQHRQEGEAFLAANATKAGVIVRTTTAPDGTPAQWQYKVLQSGPPGPSPKTNDLVVVNFTGRLIDGTVFDHSAPSGPTAFRMPDVLPAWSAALTLMKAGDKWQLFIPPSLGYADYGPPEVGMHTTLIYDLELVKFSRGDDPASADNPQK